MTNLIKEKIFGLQEWEEKIVTLKPKSKHGKDRVNQYGNKWKIISVRPNMLFSSERGPWLLLESTDEKRVLRNVKVENDRDFEVIF